MQTIGGVKLKANQLKLLSEGKPFLVEDMKRKDGSTFSSYVIPNLDTQQLSYSRVHPETGGDLHPALFVTGIYPEGLADKEQQVCTDLSWDVCWRPSCHLTRLNALR